MNKHNILLTLLTVLGLYIPGYAQENPPPAIPGHSSPNGNYISFVSDDMLQKHPDMYAHTAYFIISRMDLPDPAKNVRDTSFRQIGIARPVSSVAELQQYFSAAEIDEMSKAFNLSSADELVRHFQTKRGPADYAYYYNQLRVQLALGHLYEDKGVQAGQLKFYKVVRVDNNGRQELWSTTIMASKAGSYSLAYYKARAARPKVVDTQIYFSWSMPAGERFMNGLPPSRGPVYGNDQLSLELPDNGARLMASVRVWENGRVREVKRLIPQLNAGGDSVSYLFSLPASRDEELNVFLVPQDIYGNDGIPSDTVSAYGVNERNAPLIYNVDVQEDTDAISLRWKALPAKPYLTGILITRRDSNDALDTLATLPPTDTGFTDYKIVPGPNYTYNVTALFDEATGIVQKVPAQGVGSYTLFSLPETPQNLRAKTEGRNIRFAGTA